MRIAIGITGWRRPQYFAQVLGALRNCWDIDQFPISISIDGGYSERQLEHQQVLDRSGLSAEMTLQPENLGCAGNVGWLFNHVFEQGADAIILLEDDTVPSVDYLYYMRTMLQRFAEDERVFDVGGYNRRHLRRPRRLGEPVNVSTPNADGLVTVSVVFNPGPPLGEVLTNVGPGRKDAIFLRPAWTSFGWGTWRRIYDEIGPRWFGVKSQENIAALPAGEAFLDLVEISSHGSFYWALEKYWRGERFEVAPDVSRIQNIGAQDGKWCAGPDFHQRFHHTEVWMGAEGYRGEFEVLDGSTGEQYNLA